jgi:hypothetical protein
MPQTVTRLLTCASLALSFTLWAGGTSPRAQQQPLQGGVQEDNSRLPPDVFAAGCGGGGTPADRGDCSKFRAYVEQGGSDSHCDSLFKQAIALDDQIDALSSRARENSTPSLSQLQGELSRKLGQVEYEIDTVCLPRGGILDRVRPKPQPQPDPLYTRPNGGFGATVGGMPPVNRVASCIEQRRLEFNQKLNECSQLTKTGVTTQTLGAYNTCAEQATLTFYVGMRGCDPTKTSTSQTPPPAPPPNPDFTHGYTAEGAAPPLRYNVGFNQAVSQCLANQVTIQNLVVAIWSAAYVRARAILTVTALPGFIEAVTHPPGFSTNPDPYLQGKDEGRRICTWLLQIAVPIGRRKSAGPLIENGRVSVPPEFNFPKAVGTLPQWGPKVNPSRCTLNCGIATENGVRALFGQVLEAAPKTTRGMTDAQMEAAIGGKFGAMPMNEADMAGMIARLPEGTVAIVAGENPTYSGSGVPRGSITNWNDIPGHFFAALKYNGERFFDFQAGGDQAALPGNWIYRVMVVGNPLSH